MDFKLEPLWHDGPTLGQHYNFPGRSKSNDAPRKQTHYFKPATRSLWNVHRCMQSLPSRLLYPGEQGRSGILLRQPIVTGTSVIGIKFDGGVLIAADTLGSYGSLARYRDVSRILKVNDCTVLGASGDYADFQYLSSIIEQRVITEDCLADGFQYTPKALFSWITRVLYNRRSKFNPLWNTYVVGGLQNGEPFLGYVDKIGTAYAADSIATGFGAHIATPMMRKALETNPKLSQEDASDLIQRCLKVLYYRDCRSLNNYELVVVTKDGAKKLENQKSPTDWSIANMVTGYMG